MHILHTSVENIFIPYNNFISLIFAFAQTNFLSAPAIANSLKFFSIICYQTTASIGKSDNDFISFDC